MPYSLDDKLVIGISSRALFDLDEAHKIYIEKGLASYLEYQRSNENVALNPGTGFHLVKALLRMNTLLKERAVEVIVISRNDGDSGLRIWNSIQAHELDITRGSFAGGPHARGYLQAYSCKLFLSAEENDVREVLGTGCAAGLVYPPPDKVDVDEEMVRIAFDADSVLFGSSSEEIFQHQGLIQFLKHESELTDTPLEPGPFKSFLEALASIQAKFRERECPMRTAIVTARNAPAHKRAINTLRAWNIQVDEMHFLGGVAKAGILRAFRPHIFFDDQQVHLKPSASEIPSAEVCSPKKPAMSVGNPSHPAVDSGHK
jgi:5'-nucleotidase